MRAALVSLSLSLATATVLAQQDSYHADGLQERDLPDITAPTSSLKQLDLTTSTPSATVATGQPIDLSILTFPNAANDIDERAVAAVATEAAEAPALLPMKRDLDTVEPPQQLHERDCSHATQPDYKKTKDGAYKQTSSDGDYWIMSGEEGNKNAVDSGASSTSAALLALALTLGVTGLLI